MYTENNIDILPGPLNCGSPDKNVNTTIKGADYNVGSKIEYSCPPGNVLIGDKVRSCEKNAIWTGSAPSCRYVDCGPPPKLENGTVSLVNESTTYGAKLLYTCNENYTLVGEEIQVCKKDGKWSGTVPKCLFSICQEPPSVHGGMINVSGYKVGDTATYNCLTGYVMFGMEKLRCGLGGEWVGKPPFCKYVDCGFPTDIEYGKYDLKNGTTIVGSIVEYTCIDDYWLDGERLQRCTREGKWTADAPVCQLITCDEPEVPPGSYVIGYDFNVHSKIEYHCETGHLLIGKSSHVCEKTGEWSDSVPVCEFIDCGKVPPLNNGNVEYINGTTYLKSEVRYSCNKNFKLIGTPKRICQENKQWSDDTPKCEEIRCPEPVIPEHGVISVTGNDRLYGRTLIKTAESSHTGATSYKVGASLKYRCGRGYKVVGEALSTCENTGSWSGDVPQCIYVDCGEPKKLQHGQVVLPTNATFYGVLALYSCFENYELEGVSRRLCQENGTWSSDAPKCREIQCKEPKANKGVLYKVETRSIGGTVKYSCPKGYLIQGNSTRTCLKNGSWSGIAPECKPRNCSYPKDIENGRIIVINGTTYNSAIEYHCIPNFVREGPYLRKCMENGEWSGDEPACKVAANETRDTSQIGTGIGIGAGVLVFLLVLLGAIYFKLRKPVAVKNTENVEEAERKEDKSAAVMSYATLSDRNGHANLYENIREENLYDAPYEERRRRDSGVYEPEPGGGDNFITINGITVR
ncbi:unnamed protein product [Acanthoscelides obtectus]|uniref:Sushi domain-containing protein n=1 Tax=Acanthoscelides obtectus TaxID=200917 RepID=A0A9P0LYK1_ACAOB|nr:unnamed protein product [Acanthoscelides obtectus]CAK1675492.1 CUB and sushi domain-containing protein 2 [Acanthoscelides obtectus]